MCGLWFVSDRTGLFSTVQYTEVEVPSGDKMKVILPDGSDVTLNALSRLMNRSCRKMGYNYNIGNNTHI
ncbi:MAG: hypothetical protein MR690_07785 [Rikenellaceae bacterium]|nr:hypothetical protein [Rikenellaceae bacterium]